MKLMRGPRRCEMMRMLNGSSTRAGRYANPNPDHRDFLSRAAERSVEIPCIAVVFDMVSLCWSGPPRRLLSGGAKGILSHRVVCQLFDDAAGDRLRHLRVFPERRVVVSPAWIISERPFTSPVSRRGATTVSVALPSAPTFRTGRSPNGHCQRGLHACQRLRGRSGLRLQARVPACRPSPRPRTRLLMDMKPVVAGRQSARAGASVSPEACPPG